MTTRRNNVAMRESNDNIDHKMVITWISFADEVKYFSSAICDLVLYLQSEGLNIS